MVELKTIPAALESLLRPRRMQRIHGTVARSRAAGAWFDAALWSVFALVAVAVMLVLFAGLDVRVLAGHGINETYVVAGSVLVGVFVAGALWWRWFKWHVIATMPEPSGAFAPSSSGAP